MLKKIVHKVLAVFLAQILLFSTTSFSINTHICDNHIYAVSIFSEAEDCGMKMDDCENKNSNDCSISNEDCCLTVNTVIERNITVKTNEIKMGISPVFLLAYIVTAQNLFQSNNNTSKEYIHYIPPQINEDYTVLYEVFLI